MNAPKKTSAHSLVYISVFLLIISIIVYLNIVFQQNLKSDIAKQFNRQQLLLARGAALSIDRHIDNYVKHLLIVARLPLVNENSINRQTEQVLFAFLDDLSPQDKSVVNFQLVDAGGKVRIDRLYPNLRGTDVSDREYFSKARQLLKGEVHITGMLHLKEFNPVKRYIVFSTPLYSGPRNTKENFRGVALLAVSVDDIAGEYVSQIHVGERGYAWVVDSHGMLVYHPTNPEMIGRNVLKADDSCFACHKSFDAEKKILKGAMMEYGVYTAPMGEDKLISFSRAKVGTESWIVCVTAPYSEVTALIAKSMKLYSWLISIIFFTVIGTSIFFIILIKKKTAADERARYTAELEHKVVERTSELSREKEKLNAVLSGMGAGVSLIDRDYTVLWANDVVTKNIPAPVGGKCFAAYRGMTKPCDDCPMPAALASGKIEQAEITCRNPAMRRAASGDRKGRDLFALLSGDSSGYFQIVIAPIKDADGNVRHVVELIQDITELRKLKQQMMHSEKLAALGRISAGIAHEIGNPLTSIYSFIQILQGNKYDDFTQSTLDTISFHINRIKGIVQQMSGYSRNYHIEKAPVDVNDMVRASLDLLSHEKGMKGCLLDVDYSKSPLTVLADEKWLVSVFVNLVINALDAVPENGGRLAIKTYKEASPSGCMMAVTEVADNGTGIEPENIEKIFDPFYTTKQAGKGTGLGLAVSYNILKELKGDISVLSQPGEGTTFTVRLPMEDCID